MSKQKAPVPEKVIFQVQYEARLGFYELLIPAARRLESLYPHWESTGLRVVLRDFDKRCSLAIAHNAATYDQDSSDTAMAETHVAKMLQELPPAFEIESFTRLGYRRQYLVPVQMPFESLVSVLNVKLLSQDERLRRFMPSEVKDLMYRVDCGDGPYLFHVTVGPLHKKEVPRYVALNREHHLAPEMAEEQYLALAAQYPDVSLFADIDMYRQGGAFPVSEAVDFTQQARDRVHGLVTNLYDYVLDEKVD